MFNSVVRAAIAKDNVYIYLCNKNIVTKQYWRFLRKCLSSDLHEFTMKTLDVNSNCKPYI